MWCDTCYVPSGGRLEVATTTTPFINRFSKSCLRIMASAISVTWNICYKYIKKNNTIKVKWLDSTTGTVIKMSSPETHQSTEDKPPRWSLQQQERWGRRLWPFCLLSSLAYSVSTDESLKNKKKKSVHLDFLALQNKSKISNLNTRTATWTVQQKHSHINVYNFSLG